MRWSKWRTWWWGGQNQDTSTASHKHTTLQIVRKRILCNRNHSGLEKIYQHIQNYQKIISTCSTLYFSDWVVLDRLFFCLFSRFRNDSPRSDPVSSWVILFFPLLTCREGKTTKSSWWLKQALNYPKKLDRQIGHKNIWNHHPVESLCSQCVIDKMRLFLLYDFHTTCKCWYPLVPCQAYFLQQDPARKH